MSYPFKPLTEDELKLVEQTLLWIKTAKSDAITARIPLTKAEVDDAEDLGLMGHGLRVFKVKGTVDGLMVFFCMKNDEVVGQLGAVLHTICGIHGYIVRRTFVAQAHQQKGVGSDLFTFVWKYLKAPGFAMVSDEAQTPGGQGLWRSLGRRHEVQVLNTATGEKLPRALVPDDVLYTDDPNKSADYLLMIEAYRPVLPEGVQDRIEPYALYGAGDY